jgi:uncharacterized Tic20 family protein
MSRFHSLLACFAFVASGFMLGPVAAATGADKTATPDVEKAAALRTIPLGKGMPVVVNTGLSFQALEGFDEAKGSFEATTDLRLSWVDLRLRYPASEVLHGYKEYRMSAAEQQLSKIWTPTVAFVNRLGEPSMSERRLRIYPDGRVETITRTTAVFKTQVDVTRFPFDQQTLQVELQVKEDTVETVDLDYLSDDLLFSRPGKRVDLTGWELGLVNLKRELIAGWNGDRYAKVIAGLNVRRDASSTLATIFIPLFASLLIPFLAAWMNRAEKDGFEVDGFELANFIIGGLFAVIALSFTLDSTFPLLSKSDNTVSRLIGLNFTALAFGMIITVVFYGYSLPARWFGAFVQQELFKFLVWSFPLLFFSFGIGFVVMAAA